MRFAISLFALRTLTPSSACTHSMLQASLILGISLLPRRKKVSAAERKVRSLMRSLFRVESLAILHWFGDAITKNMHVTQNKAGSLHLFLSSRASITRMLQQQDAWDGLRDVENITLFTKQILTVISTNKVQGLLVTYVCARDALNSAPASCRALRFCNERYPYLCLNF